MPRGRPRVISPMLLASTPLAATLGVALLTTQLTSPPTAESLPSIHLTADDPSPARQPKAREGDPRASDPPAPSEFATRRRCEILLEGGHVVRGQLLEETDESVRALVANIETTYSRDEIVELTILDSVYERYLELREALPEDDVEQRLMLVQWLLNRRAYRLALHECERVLEIDKANPDALRLHRHLEAQLALLRGRDSRSRTPDERAGNEPQKDPEHRRDERFPRLAREQINLIKVFELDLRDPPRMRIDRETIDELLERYADHELIPSSPEARRALYRKPAHQIVDLMFRLRARDLYARVEVLGHPESMQRFRDDVHRGWLMRGCATSRCHGGQAAGRLWLYNQHVNSEPTVYTNFLILERFRLDDGEPLMRYDEPEKSPLLQMALPRARSSHPHPPINELGREIRFRAPLSSRDSDGFRDAIRWIKSMYQPRPEYPITYSPPVPAGVIETLEDRPAGRQPR